LTVLLISLELVIEVIQRLLGASLKRFICRGDDVSPPPTIVVMSGPQQGKSEGEEEEEKAE